MKRVLLTIMFSFPVIVYCQQILSLKNAVDTALKNNFDIRIAKNITEINKINNTFGNAGGLPLVNAAVSDNASINNINQKLSSGTDINKNNVSNNNVNAGVGASITLFNGFKIIATKERLSLLQSQSEFFLNQQIQNTIAAIMIKYYDIVRQTSYLKIIEQSLDISKKKLEIVTLRRNVGMANDADLLQSQIDLNLAQQNIKSQSLVIEQSKTDLLQFMSIKKYYRFETTDSIVVNTNIAYDSIINFLNRNVQYLSAQQQIKINEQLVKETKAQRYPSVKINTGYNFANTNSGAGQVLLNQSYGPTAGFTVQIPIYNGNIYNTQKNVALYNVANAKLQKESLLNDITANAIKTYNEYSTTIEQLASQQQNYELSKKLVDIVIKRFELNQATVIDIKNAQASYENSGYMVTNLKFAAKSAEIELKALIYKLTIDN